jgi:hypothetical protein
MLASEGPGNAGRTGGREKKLDECLLWWRHSPWTFERKRRCRRRRSERTTGMWRRRGRQKRRSRWRRRERAILNVCGHIMTSGNPLDCAPRTAQSRMLALVSASSFLT